MNNKEYVDSWIENSKSGTDIFRIRYLDPFLKKIIKGSRNNTKILDIGCGWGETIQFLKKNQRYVGVDKIKEFFPYIKKEFNNKNIRLIKGIFPSDLGIKEKSFDLVLCSMVLHLVKDYKKSIKVLFEECREKGEICIITFSDKGNKSILKFFKSPKMGRNYAEGDYILPSGAKINNRVYFHSEKEIETEIEKYGKFNKKYLGPLFVGYVCKKSK